MRSYGQYCSVAKALDLIGDRWSVLIVRELLLRGPCRYTDLLGGLPGIATNLLADRLRELAKADILAREDDRKSTRLNSSHTVISYAVFCLKKKKKHSK